jgi:hypothetical protein
MRTKEEKAASDKAYREANKALIAAKKHAYYLANKESILTKAKAWVSANRERQRELQYRETSEIRDSYIMKSLLRDSGLSRDQITPEMIDSKRKQIQAHRARKAG